MHDFNGYSFGYDKKDLAADIKERGAYAVITDIADRCDYFLQITQAFEQVGKYFGDYLENIYEYHKGKDNEGWDVVTLFEENQKMLSHFAQFIQSGNYIFTELLEDYKMQLENLACALDDAKIEEAKSDGQQNC